MALILNYLLTTRSFTVSCSDLMMRIFLMSPSLSLRSSTLSGNKIERCGAIQTSVHHGWRRTGPYRKGKKKWVAAAVVAG